MPDITVDTAPAEGIASAPISPATSTGSAGLASRIRSVRRRHDQLQKLQGYDGAESGRKIPEPMSELQLRTLFEICDKDRTGKIDFKEVATLVLDGMPEIPDARASEAVQRIFHAYAKGGEMDLGQWNKLCKEKGFVAEGFKRGDADILFTKACEDGRKMDLERFEFALVYLAFKKAKTIARIHDMISPEELPPPEPQQER
eukprot:TRINITY_DN9951_c0_g2_i1.p1 TRINITY_DN9951_c0_g2~~TRINITY_DN9951_c0_g2_i1.p1  ORF type:complete len:201 (-),score=46.09 TRINITY_DN9951_c0_g2_i1:34-636(-)